MQSLDVFSLRDAVVGDYRTFATSFTTIYAEDIRQKVDAIYADQRYWPEPLIQINPKYKSTTTVEKLVRSGTLDARCAEIFRSGGAPLTLYKHQEQAVALASQGASYVVTTGTGSGKSLCFFVPIVNAVLADKRRGGAKRTRAIIIYPMNALANSQVEELDKYMKNVAGEKPVTFARYTGQEDDDQRREVAENPPDILLTNFMMLELLMTRQEVVDRRVMGNCEGLQFLVLDELHTYRGRQGADVALLVRRVRERLSPERLQCIGTSATMASEGTIEDKNRVVAAVASKLFATAIPESNVIVETLERVTDPNLTDENVRPALGAAIAAGIGPSLPDDELRNHPLSVWIETRLGIKWSAVDQRWQRAQPLTVTEAVQQLSADAACDVEPCRVALRDLLLLSSSRGLFAFKLHQFISGAGHAYATLEPPGRRSVTVDGQQYLPGEPEKRLYPVHFCRECGQEYHPVRLVKEGPNRKFMARDIDDAPPPRREEDQGGPDVADDGDDGDGEVFGFLTLHPPDPEFTFADRDLDYPENWLELDSHQTPRLKAHYRPWRAVAINVEPTGQAGGGGARAWFMPGKFRLCLRCGETQTTAARDRTRLASLSAEGRSSATTVLVSSALRWMHGVASRLLPTNRKLLGFTDNRQDAALQAGHFNDFLFVSLIRAGFLGALDAAGAKGLSSEELGSAQQKALGFDGAAPELRAEWLLEPTLRGLNLQEAEGTLRQVLSYRVWFDQRRGWRYTNPNLEQLELVDVDYKGIEELASDEELFKTAPAVLQRATPAVRVAVYRELLKHLRQWMAIRSHVLDQTIVDQMLARSHGRLRAPWGFGVDERPRRARWLFVQSPQGVKDRDEELIVRGGSRSALGRALKSSELWDGDRGARELKPAEFDTLVEALLKAAATHGLVSEEATPFGSASGWRLSDACVRFRRAMPTIDPRHPNESAFFRDFYANLAQMLRAPGHPLFGFEAREHTAQVDAERRAIREKRFRYGEKECKELADAASQLKDLGEANRFLPVLFCSPTMELGVDISALNGVYLRNVPPTPANYAQRSGRAGRSGQAALVLTYCSSQSPHDQYFFRIPKAMMHGEVRPPLLDLANQDLVNSHLQAVWLSCNERPLSASISELLVLEDTARPLRPDVRAPMREVRVTDEAARRMKRVLAQLVDELTPTLAPWYPGADAHAAAVAQSALDHFDDAFRRWRDLFVAAEQQRDAARKTMDAYTAPQQEKRAAQSRHAQAIDQLNLLQKGSNSNSNDFYTYRYLATEGFLPGYNFPRLPLMAYVPATNDGRGKQTYLQRPRFLALSEFGPRSLVYHEGRAYRVVRAMLSLGQNPGAGRDARLPTLSVRICESCGAGDFTDQASLCRACGSALGGAEIVKNVYRIENVATQPAERITANDEERQRQGFELQTTFEWAERDQVLDVRKGAASDTDGEIIRLAYGPGATITRLNKGLRRRANLKQLGFNIDPLSGYWAKNEDEDDETVKDPTVAPRQWIVPCVQDHKNALLLQPVERELSMETLATVQHALQRGIEARFQLEEGEVLAEPMPKRDARTGVLLYEATEGGAGVLTRLVAEPQTIAQVALEALRIMHFDIPDASKLPGDERELKDVAGTLCVAACYKCLMSYYNQPDHERIDRRDSKARELLLRLARATTSGVESRLPRVSDRPTGSGDGGDSIPARWLELAAAKGIPRQDAEPLVAGDLKLPLVWRGHYVVASFGALAPDASSKLGDQGFEVIAFAESEGAWDDAFRRLAAALGRS